MRLTLLAIAIGGLWLGAAVANAQTQMTAPKTFSGVKLVDFKARTPEQTVTLHFESDKLRIVDPAAKSELKTFAYSDLKVAHTISSAPPASAGDPSAAATQQGSMPMYMGKTPRNWLTLSAGDEQVTLRVSAKVYEQVKAALEAHRVEISESK
jgi:hypothetical protein